MGAVGCNLALRLPCPSSPQMARFGEKRSPPFGQGRTFRTGLGLCPYLCSWQVACFRGWSFLGRKVNLNLLLPLIELAADGNEVEGETPVAKQKWNVVTGGAARTGRLCS